MNSTAQDGEVSLTSQKIRAAVGAITISELIEASDPFDLLELNGAHCAYRFTLAALPVGFYGIVRLPGSRGWTALANRSGRHWSRIEERLSILSTALNKPLVPPAESLTDVIQALGTTPTGRYNEGTWNPCTVLLWCILNDLAGSDPARHGEHVTMLALGHPDALTDVDRFEAWLANHASPGGRDEAYRLINRVAADLWPALVEESRRDGDAATGDLATEEIVSEFLCTRRDQWNHLFVREWLRNESRDDRSPVRKELIVLYQQTAPLAKVANPSFDDYDFFLHPDKRDDWAIWDAEDLARIEAAYQPAPVVEST